MFYIFFRKAQQFQTAEKHFNFFLRFEMGQSRGENRKDRCIEQKIFKYDSALERMKLIVRHQRLHYK